MVGDLVTKLGSEMSYAVPLHSPKGWISNCVQRTPNKPGRTTPGHPWYEPELGLVNLVEHMHRRAGLAQWAVLQDPLFWEEGQDGQLWPTPTVKMMKFLRTLPSLIHPGRVMPPEEFHGPLYNGNPRKVLKGMMNLNQGAVAEIRGEDGPMHHSGLMPTDARAYHVQFMTTMEKRNKMAEAGLPGCGVRKVIGKRLPECEKLPVQLIRAEIGSTTMQKLCYDCDGQFYGFQPREAYVITLPELVQIAPKSHCSLFSMYSWWLEANKIIKSRFHPSHFESKEKHRQKKNDKWQPPPNGQWKKRVHIMEGEGAQNEGPPYILH